VIDRPHAMYMNPKIASSADETPWFMVYQTIPMAARIGMPVKNDALTMSRRHPSASCALVSMKSGHDGPF